MNADGSCSKFKTVCSFICIAIISAGPAILVLMWALADSLRLSGIVKNLFVKNLRLLIPPSKFAWEERQEAAPYSFESVDL